MLRLYHLPAPILVADWSMHRSRDTLLIKLRLYQIKSNQIIINYCNNLMIKHEFFGGKSALCQFSSSSKSEVTLIQLPKKHNGAFLYYNFLELAIMYIWVFCYYILINNTVFITTTEKYVTFQVRYCVSQKVTCLRLIKIRSINMNKRRKLYKELTLSRKMTATLNWIDLPYSLLNIKDE